MAMGPLLADLKAAGIHVGSLYSREAKTRQATARAIIDFAKARVPADLKATKAYTLTEQFADRTTVSMDCIDPRIGRMLVETGWLNGGLNSNASILQSLVEGKSGYTGPERLEDVLAKYLPSAELCEFLGIGSLADFVPEEHGRAAFKFMVLNLVADLNYVLRQGQLSVEVTQFGPVRETDLPRLLGKKDVDLKFFGQFQAPTMDEMIAEALIMDGGLSKTAVKVALGWDGYRLISEIFQLGLCPNATLSFPTMIPSAISRAHGIDAEKVGLVRELAIAARLGAGMLSPFWRRTEGVHGKVLTAQFMMESVEVSRRFHAADIAASIGSAEMAEEALNMGAHIVATPPHVIQYKGNKGIEACAAWLSERVPEVVAGSTKVPIYPKSRAIISYDQSAIKGNEGNVFRSPLAEAGYASFVTAELSAVNTVAAFIAQQMKVA